MVINQIQFFIMLTVVKLALLLPLDDKFQQLFNRSDIQCPSGCSRYSAEMDAMINCCVCYAKPQWNDVGNLKIEMTENDTCSALFRNPLNLYTYYYANYRHGNLTEIPCNTCNFTNIITIDFSFNRISNIDVVSCLLILDTLILKSNAIEYFNKDVFLQMKRIRVIDLSYNRIRSLEPMFLMNVDGFLVNVDLSHNRFRTIDVTNIVWTKQKAFCEVNFSNNMISSITNSLNWACHINSTFGYGGQVSFRNNYINGSQFINRAALGFSNMVYLGKLMNYGFDFRENQLICDCKLYSFVRMARLVISILHRDYFDLICESPPELNGIHLLDVIKDGKFDVFVCNISMDGKCPPKCHCFHQPSQGRTVVNCSHSGKTKLPSALPDHTHLDVDFSHNRIDLVDRRFIYSSVDYFSRIKKLNLQNNSIKELPEYLLSKFINVTWLDLRTNEIINIPRALQSIQPCRVAMGRIEMTCNCNDIWLQDWLPMPNTSCFDNTSILCRIEDNVRTIMDMTKESLGCQVNNENDKNMYTLLAALCLVFSLIISCIYLLRFYLFILVVRPILKLVRKKPLQALNMMCMYLVTKQIQI